MPRRPVLRQIKERDFAVRGSDPYGFDREGDGLGCEG